jgi:hypothetical protein
MDRLRAFLASVKASLDALWAKLKTDVSVLWEKDKAFVILFGVVILGVKFREILISLIVASSKRLFDKTQKESDALLSQENDYNKQANDLVKKAEDLKASTDLRNADVDWYKK